MGDGTEIKEIEKTRVMVPGNRWIKWDGCVIDDLTCGYVTDYQLFRAESDSSDRYPRQESISGIGRAVVASRHKRETAWLEE